MSPGRRPRAATLVAGACLLVAALAAPGYPASGAVHAPAPAARDLVAGRHLEATLRGGMGGDPDGTGHASFTLSRSAGRVCADVTWHHIKKPDAAHIHRKSDGQIVVDLSGSVTGGAHCNRHVSGRLVGRILEHPRRYYFNVHNADFPAGAIRGALHH